MSLKLASGFEFVYENPALIRRIKNLFEYLAGFDYKKPDFKHEQPTPLRKRTKPEF